MKRVPKIPKSLKVDTDTDFDINIENLPDPASQVVTVDSLLPSEKVMEELGLEHEEYGDFLVALNILGHMVSDSMSLSKAAASVGMNRQTIADPYWKKLITKAERLMIGESAMHSRAHIPIALNAFPAAVRRVAHIAQFAEKDSDAILAAEFLKTIVDSVPEMAVDATEQSKYLKGFHAYNPMQPLQIAQIATQINNYNGAPTPTPDMSVDVVESVDVTDVVEEESMSDVG